MEKGEREVRERKAVRGRERGNGSGPDQVREEIDASVHTPILFRI